MGAGSSRWFRLCRVAGYETEEEREYREHEEAHRRRIWEEDGILMSEDGSVACKVVRRSIDDGDVYLRNPDGSIEEVKLEPDTPGDREQ